MDKPSPSGPHGSDIALPRGIPRDLPSSVSHPSRKRTRKFSAHEFEIAVRTAVSSTVSVGSKVFPEGVAHFLKAIRDRETASRERIVAERRMTTRIALALLGVIAGLGVAVQHTAMSQSKDAQATSSEGPSAFMLRPHYAGLSKVPMASRLVDNFIERFDYMVLHVQDVEASEKRQTTEPESLQPSEQVPEQPSQPAILSPEQVAAMQASAKALLKNEKLSALAVGSTAVLMTEHGVKSAVVLSPRVLVTTKKGFMVNGQPARLTKVQSGPQFNLQQSWEQGDVPYVVEADPSVDFAVIVFDKDLFRVETPLSVAQNTLQPGESFIICGSPHESKRQRVAGWSVPGASVQGVGAPTVVDTTTPLKEAMEGGVVLNQHGQILGMYTTQALSDATSNSSVPTVQSFSPEVLRVLVDSAKKNLATRVASGPQSHRVHPAGPASPSLPSDVAEGTMTEVYRALADAAQSIKSLPDLDLNQAYTYFGPLRSKTFSDTQKPRILPHPSDNARR